MSVGIGIVGSGYMGRTYAECVTRHVVGAHLVGVAGGTRAPGLAAEYGVAVEPSIEALVERDDVDAVIITSPPTAHPAQTTAAARHGKHVLVETPMATTRADCQAMIEDCRAAGVSLSVVKPWRYRGTGREAGRLIHADAIGPVTMLRMSWLATGLPFNDKPWFRDPREGGPLLDAGSHCFDYLRWAARSEPLRVYARVHQFGTEQTAMALVEFASGALANLWLSYEIPTPGFSHSLFRSQIVGQKGILDVDGYGALRLGRGGSWQTIHEQVPIDAIGGMFEWPRLEAFVLLVQDFVEAIGNDRQPPVAAEDGLAAVTLGEASYASNRGGAPVELDLAAVTS
jgi:predicted dehydrogenase